MAKKMLPPRTNIWWVPISVADTEAEVLSAALYAPGGGAIDISCAVVSGYTLAATDSATDSTTSICDTTAANTPTQDNFEADLTFFREHIDEGTGKADATSPYEIAFQLFKVGGARGNITGWLVERVGYPQTAAAAKGQPVSGYRVMPDNPRTIIGEGTAPIQFGVKFMPQGKMFTNQNLTA